VYRVVAKWAGFTGSPGFSNFYFICASGNTHTAAGAVNGLDQVRNFFNGLSALFPVGLTINMDPAVAVLDEASGVALSEFSVTPGGTVTGTATGAYSAPSGAVVNWRTSSIVAGRKVRGRTFLVPLGPIAYQANGTLADNVRTDINTAASIMANVALGSPAKLGVWHRAVNGAGGVHVPVTSATVPDMAAVLRSRRD
jgi:hypothetical protein